MIRICILVTVLALQAACSGERGESSVPAETSTEQAHSGTVVFADVNLWDGTGDPALSNVHLLTRDGRIERIVTGPVPAAERRIDLNGAWVVPGFVNAHGHISGRWASDDTEDVGERVVVDLTLYARYGVTGIVSLGNAPVEAFTVRRAHETASLNHARVRLAGAVVSEATSDAARQKAQANIDAGADWIKIRVDDDLGNAEKMPWPAIDATLALADSAGIPVAAHIFYLEDAARLLTSGVGLIAHSVRDQQVTQSFVDTLLDSDVCYVPTLTREVSTFVYENRPEFFDDPFFLQAAEQSEIDRLSDPEFIARFAARPVIAQYKQALKQAQDNLRILTAAGVPIAMGTDSGPSGRFPGYFEHMEFDLMAESGMTPEQILLSATSVAARCVQLDDVGTLETGKWADFVVLEENPLLDIRATRSIRQVYVAGNLVPRR